MEDDKNTKVESRKNSKTSVEKKSTKEETSKKVTPQKKSVTPKKSASKADAKQKEKEEKAEKEIEEKTKTEENKPEEKEKKETKKSKKSTKKEDKVEEEEQQQEEKKTEEKPETNNKRKSKKSTRSSVKETEAPKLTKRIKMDNRELFKTELKRSNWPTTEELKKQIDEFKGQLKDESLDKELLAKIYNTIDLTSLNSTDGYDYIEEWLQKQLFDVYKDHGLKPAAICVYPIFGKQVRKTLKTMKDVKTAVVSTCFPTGQTFMEVKLQETKIAAREGAEEVDMVVSRGLWNEGMEYEVLEEIFETKKACCNAHLKVILENCELKGLDSIYKLSYLSLCAGGDFIKTSTGKGKWGALIDEFAVMCLALRDFLETRDEFDVRGIKAAGGISDSKTAHQFYQIFELILKKKVTPEVFRIGASSLCKAIVKDIQELKE